MSLGEVDTLNLLSEKLDNLLNDSQGYYESFLEANNLYKNGKLGDKEFFAKLGDYVVAYSALEFLSIKVIMELKKAVDRLGAGKTPGGTQSPGLMPGMGSPGMAGGYGGGMIPPRTGTAENPVGGPPSVISAQSGFGEPGTLPTPEPSLVSQNAGGSACASCGTDLRPNAKFCVKCGTRV